MFELAAETGCGLVMMHIEGPPARGQRHPPRYDDPVEHLQRLVLRAASRPRTAGESPRSRSLSIRASTSTSALADGLEILRRLGELKTSAARSTSSLSRKDLLGALLAGSWECRLPAPDREWATAAATALAVTAGADLLRLHDASALQAMRIAAAIEAPRGAQVG